MPELDELYPAAILEHHKRPHNFHAMEGATCQADGYNPLCGDRLTLYLDIQGGVIRDASFRGSGCAISQASASMLTDVVQGKTAGEAENVCDSFGRLIDPETGPGIDRGLPSQLAAFASVRRFPARMACAGLAWQTLHLMLHSADDGLAP
ncbi:MAG: SUF system NifU family Fe-S cluster assembly protein [Acidobacteriia bacterium]|nr:SUF system NifU family Fe-S cluster assembly protein [Terriglobia bacterium]